MKVQPVAGVIADQLRAAGHIQGLEFSLRLRLRRGDSGWLCAPTAGAGGFHCHTGFSSCSKRS
jgi:hypothetical protein